MANTRVALAKGFSVAVVIVLLVVGGIVLFGRESFSESGLLLYLLTLSFALTGTRGIWSDRYKIATVGAVGMLVTAVWQTAQAAGAAFLLGLAVLLGVALVLGYSGRTREHLE